MGPSDVFLNITGGLKTEDPAMDLAVCVALAGSAKDRVIDAPMLFAAEIGLGGELRPVTAIEARLGEASRLGYNLACVADQQPIAQIPKGMRILKHTLLRGLLEEVLA
jgi:DNA repair protein RadA/Sms